MSENQNLFVRVKRDLFIAGGAGLIVAISIGAVAALIGQVSDAEARRLVEAIIPTSRLFCSTILTVSATILALMLTLIGLGSQSELTLADAHYHRILKIAFYDALLFAIGSVMFVLHCVPVYESDSIPTWWYSTIYYGVLISTSVVAGGAVAIIALLYLAVKDMVQVIGLGDQDHYLAVAQKEKEGQNGDSEATAASE